MRTRVAVLFVCFVAGVGLVARAERPEPVPVRSSFTSFPMQLEGWRGVQEPPFDANILAVLGVDDYLTRAYFKSDRSGVGLYIGYYGSQRQGDTMHSPLNCLPGAGWQPLEKSYLPIQVTDINGVQSEITVNRYVIEKGLDQQVVLYWYQSHGRVVASEYWGKFYLISDAMRYNRTDAALVRVIAPVAPNQPNAEAVAEEAALRFARDLMPALQPYLPR